MKAKFRHDGNQRSEERQCLTEVAPIRRYWVENRSSRELRSAWIEFMEREPRINATALQTVGSEGYDGFIIAIVDLKTTMARYQAMADLMERG